MKSQKTTPFDVIHVLTVFNVPDAAVIVAKGVEKDAAIAITADYFQAEWDRYFCEKGQTALIDHLNRFLAEDNVRSWELEPVIETHNGPNNSSNYIFFRESGKGIKGWKC